MNKIVAGLIMNVGFIAAFSGVGIVCLQILRFLMAGSWMPISLINLGILLTSADWFLHPQTWLGVYKILDIIPASLVLFGSGYAAMIWATDAFSPKTQSEHSR